MGDTIRLPLGREAVVEQVSVHVAEYSSENGGRDAGEQTIYVVEVLFPDGTWTSSDHSTEYGEACSYAVDEAKQRGAVVLDQCAWPNRRVASFSGPKPARFFDVIGGQQHEPS